MRDKFRAELNVGDYIVWCKSSSHPDVLPAKVIDVTDTELTISTYGDRFKGPIFRLTKIHAMHNVIKVTGFPGIEAFNE